MRAVLAVLILATASLIAPARAAEPHFCTVEKDGARNCSYASMAECQTAMTMKTDKCLADTAVTAAKADTAAKDELDKILDRVNKKSESLILCRGC
jgi:hypothetical protein